MLDGDIIRKLRETRGLITYTFAKAVGISQSMVSMMERGLRVPRIEILKRVANYLGCTVDFLLKK